MDLHAILIRAPVNRLAASVVSQRRAAREDTPLNREELIYLVDRLARKRRLLEAVLGIKTRSQRSNLMYKHKRRLPQFRQAQEPRAFTEYIVVGREMQRLIVELAERRKAWKAMLLTEERASIASSGTQDVGGK